MTTTIIIKNTSALSTPELLEIMRNRIDVFVVEQNCPYHEIDAQDAHANHVILRVDGQFAAYARIISNADERYISFGRVLVNAAYRRQHLGRLLVQTTIDAIHDQQPDRPIKIAGQSYLQKFYESFGFRAVSAEYLEDGIPHIDLVLN